MNSVFIAALLLFLIILAIAIVKIRRANPEQSASTMHPDNFKKPRIEKVEEINSSGEDSHKKRKIHEK